MTDHIAALEAALHTEAMNLPLEVLFGVLVEVEELREDLAGEQARAEMHADLGRRTAEALGLKPEEGRSHMPEVAKRLKAENEEWRKQCDTLTHQVICCGVAARHPDATLTTRGAYAGKWNSQQAEEVRKLRADRDRLRAENEALKRLLTLEEIWASHRIMSANAEAGLRMSVLAPLVRAVEDEKLEAAQAAKED
jgi:hypothetical protein